MNEYVFFIHILIVLSFSYIAYRCGKGCLMTWVALQAILANLFVLKQITLFSFHVPCSDVFAIGSILGLNLLQEFYGKETRKEVMLICFFALAFFSVMSEIHLLYVPSPLDTMSAAYHSILSHSPRILFASMGTFLVTQAFDGKFFTLLQKTTLPLSVRNGCALVLSQFLDTVLFTFLGLYGLIAHLGETILLSYTVKLTIICILSVIFFLSKNVWKNLSEKKF